MILENGYAGENVLLSSFSMPILRHNYADIPLLKNFPDLAKLTISGDNLLLAVEPWMNPSNHEKQKLLIWAADRDVATLIGHYTNTLFIDGTWNVTPHRFEQKVAILTFISRGAAE